MKLLHDIENDVEHTIPPEGGPDSAWLFRAMTERALAHVSSTPGKCYVDLASGLGQDTFALARAVLNDERSGNPTLVLGIEPSNRMLRFGLDVLAGRQPSPTGAGSSIARFIRGLGEEIPLRTESVDSLLCKGALDHFMDPRLTVGEIARVLRPGGRAVIALANYDSLSCRWGRWWDRDKPRAADAAPPFYEPPPDHLTRFTYQSILALAQPPLRIRRVEGLSLFWGFPPWGRLLERLPSALQRLALSLAYRVARLRPQWADVIVLVAEKRSVPKEP